MYFVTYLNLQYVWLTYDLLILIYDLFMDIYGCYAKAKLGQALVVLFSGSRL